MTLWGYDPVGDHSREAQMNLEGFLRWERVDSSGQIFTFLISTAKWSSGTSEPCWPAGVIVKELRSQHVFHGDDPDPSEGGAGSGPNTSGPQARTSLRRRR